jgi:hypothetical protein
MIVPRPPTPEEAESFESAGEFLQHIGIEIQNWLYSMTLSSASNGKRWVLSATLSCGATVIVHRLSAHGHSMLKLEGELPDGTDCLFAAHHQMVQLLAYHVPRKLEEPPKREIGFHTGLGQDITIDQ